MERGKERERKTEFFPLQQKLSEKLIFFRKLLEEETFSICSRSFPFSLSVSLLKKSEDNHVAAVPSHDEDVPTRRECDVVDATRRRCLGVVEMRRHCCVAVLSREPRDALSFTAAAEDVF